MTELDFDNILDDAQEIIKILTSIVKTTKEKLN